MKNKLSVIACFGLLFLALGCQDNKKEEAAPRVVRSGSARRACPDGGGVNTFLYAFIKPDSDYGYGNGCVSYYIHRGSTRQVKVKMANVSGSTMSLGQLYIVMPYDPNSITYSVASVTGGSTATYTPYPATGNGSSILWTAYSIPAYTTYELVLNITGVTGGTSAENGLSLAPTTPCYVTPDIDCDADENMHVILTN